jgi:peptide deformylase
MTLLKIARLGHPVLLERAAPVGDAGRPGLQRLVDDMIATMQDAEGVGLAAPQVHESLRLIVVSDPTAVPEGERPAPLVLLDPELEAVGAERDSAFEGCLSIPGIRGLVPRWRRVAWRARDRDGAAIGGLAEGFLARVLQHEVDHLDGVLYPMRMADLRDLAFDSELRHLQAWRAGRAEAQG